MPVPNVLPTDVKSFAPELAGVLDPVWATVLEFVNELDLSPNGATAIVTRMARILLAAHIVTMLSRGGLGIAGPLTSESVGGIRRSYGFLGAKMGGAAYMSTRYGQEYLDVLGMSAAARGPIVL